MSEERDPIHVHTYRDADAAFTMAKALWKGSSPDNEVLQSTFATLLIHMQHTRKGGVGPAPSAGRAVPGQAPGRPAPAPAPATTQAAAHVAVPACPICGGEMWDNRDNKKNPKAPDFKCKDKTCKDEKGFAPGLWVEKPKGGGRRAAPAAAPQPVPTAAGDFRGFPKALEDDDELPF